MCGSRRWQCVPLENRGPSPGNNVYTLIIYEAIWGVFDTCHGLKDLKTYFLLLLAMGFFRNTQMSAKVWMFWLFLFRVWGFFFRLFEHYWLIWSGRGLVGRKWCHIHSMHQSQSKNILIKSDFNQWVANVARSDLGKQISWVFRYLISIIRYFQVCIITMGALTDWALIVIGQYM